MYVYVLVSDEQMYVYNTWNFGMKHRQVPLDLWEKGPAIERVPPITLLILNCSRSKFSTSVCPPLHTAVGPWDLIGRRPVNINERRFI